MKLRFIMCFIFPGLLFLLSACGGNPATSGVSSTPTALATHKPSLTPTSMSTQSSTTTPSLPADCPAPGTAHQALLQSAQSAQVASSVSQHIIYYSELGGIQVSANHAKLMSYDVATGKASSLISFSDPATGIISAQLSADNQWLLFVSDLSVQGPSSTSSYILQKLQIVRADGQHLQTLMCNIGQAFGYDAPLLSPDNKYIAFDAFNGNKKYYAIDVLNVSTGEIRELHASANFHVRSWIDTTRLYAILVQDRSATAAEEIYLFDMNYSTNKYSKYPVAVGSLVSLCDTLEVDSAKNQLFTSSCGVVNANCRAGIALQGPSMLSTQLVTGGKATSLYTDTSHAIVTFRVIDTTTYLIYIQNSAGDLSQNGLWKVSAQGNHLTRLTKETAPMNCYDAEGYAGSSPEVFSDGQSYALRINGTLLLGSLNAGTATTIHSNAETEDTLQLLGFTTI